MKPYSNYVFSNLLGTVYRQGQLIFLNDGNSLLSPVGNRVSLFHLKEHKTLTLPFQTSKNIQTISLSPDQNKLWCIDIQGRGILVDIKNEIVLCHLNFKSPVIAAQWSPCGKYFAVSCGKNVFVWRITSFRGEHQAFFPCILHRKYTGFLDNVISIDWCPNSLYFVAGSKDLTARVFSLHPIANFTPLTLGGHQTPIIKTWWNEKNDSDYSTPIDIKNTEILTLGKDGFLSRWKYIVSEPVSFSEDSQDLSNLASNHQFNHSPSGKWKLVVKKQYTLPDLEHRLFCQSAAYHHESSMLILGYSNGAFGLFNLETSNLIHSLSISNGNISSIALNPSGSWIAFGCAAVGQLVVWEWKTETFILKQQGHHTDLNCVNYNPEGSIVATGGQDGKVKLWNLDSGFCYVTFDKHTAPVTSIKFAQNGNVIISSSLDGTIRCFDRLRYRNFRTLTALDTAGANSQGLQSKQRYFKENVQFFSLAVDKSGEIVCGGSLHSGGFRIFVWGMRTGSLLDTLNGHTAPVSCMAFSPTAPILASGSWDGTVRIWDVFEDRKSVVDPCVHSQESDVLALAWNPDGTIIVTATLNGFLNFWQVEKTSTKLLKTINCKRDIWRGRKRDSITKKIDQLYFSSVSFTSNGKFVLAAGESTYVCLYSVDHGVLLKKFKLSNNKSFDGILHKLNSKFISKRGINLETVKKNSNLAKPVGFRRIENPKNEFPLFHVKDLAIAPSGREFSCVTPEGLYVYRMNSQLVFNPYDIDFSITPASIYSTLMRKQYIKTLFMAIKLNIERITLATIVSIPLQEIPKCVGGLPLIILPQLFENLSSLLKNHGTHFQLSLFWLSQLLIHHGDYLSASISRSGLGFFKLSNVSQQLLQSGLTRESLLSVKKSVATIDEKLTSLVLSNINMCTYLAELPDAPLTTTIDT